MGFWDWISGAGTNAYNWAGDNPLAALSLGVGAAGTGFGIYDQWRANQEVARRNKLAESFIKAGPYAFAPNWSPEQLKAMYFRPASGFMQERGLTSGGTFQGALANAALQADKDRFQLGNQALGARLQGLGYNNPVPASGSVGAFGQSLNNLLLMQALSARNKTQQQPTPNTLSPFDPMLANYGIGPDDSLGNQPSLTTAGGIGNLYPEEFSGYGPSLSNRT